MYSDQPIDSTAPGFHCIRTIDMHTGGEPLRVVTGGYPEIMGNTVLEKRRYARDQLDHLRKALMWEPRGHRDMYGCLMVRPSLEEAHFGVIFMHNEGYSTMCGHAVIALAKLAVEEGWVTGQGSEVPVNMEVPAGLIRATAFLEGDKVRHCRFRNVPAFSTQLDGQVRLKDHGTIKYDLAYGGAWYAYVDARPFNVPITARHAGFYANLGMQIKQAVIRESDQFRHPYEDDLSFLYGTIFSGPPQVHGNHSRNICIFADGEVDRSPTGSGVSGRLALLYERNEIGLNDPFRIESVIGAVFEGQVTEELSYGPHQAVIPEVTGTSYLTGRHQFCIDPEDEFGEGFLLQ